jgi:hypothetical protein
VTLTAARSPAWIACLAAPLAFVACAASVSGPRLVPVPPPDTYCPARLERILHYQDALAAIARTFEGPLGLQRPRAVLELLADRRSFEAALVESGYPPEFARATARRVDLIGGYRRVLVNETALAPLPWSDRVRLLAHELAHALQYELGGGRRGASEQWLREGFAEWVARRVIEELGGLSLGGSRRGSLARTRRLRRDGSLPLDAMGTFPQWVELLGGHDRDAVYAYAFLAAEFALERHGLPAVLRYFSLFATSDDRTACFREAFGEDLATFEAALRERLGE